MAGSANGQPQQASQRPNVFDQSAQAYTQALETAGDARRAAGRISTRNPYQSVSAQNITSGQLSDTDLSPYMNPFQGDVIDTTVSDLERARQQAMIQAGGQATQANAFGGSRHGVAMAETNRGFDDNMARALAGLNTQNFQQAQQAGQFDISNTLQADMSNQQSNLQAAMSNQNARIQAQQAQAQAAQARAQMMNAASQTQGQLSNLGFGMGMQANDAMMRAGGMQQGMQQQLIDQAAQQYGGWSGSPQQSLDTVNNTLGSIPIPQTQTQSSSPGLFDYLTLGATTAGHVFCWVAREVYGPENPAWLEFREWMLTKAPTWLLEAYKKHGQKWAEWVKRNPWSKRILRPLMDSVR